MIRATVMFGRSIQTNEIERLHEDYFRVDTPEANVVHDDCFSEAEKDEMIQKILERLRKELGVLPPVIKDYFYCLGKHFERLDGYDRWPSINGFTREALADILVKRQIVRETLTQLELLDREVDEILMR